MKVHYPEGIYARAALLVLRELVEEPIYMTDAIYLFPQRLLSINDALNALLTWPKPVACISLALTSVLAIGIWTDEQRESFPGNGWSEGMRREVYGDAEASSAGRTEPRVFLRSQTEAIAMTFDQAVRFQEMYTFPMAGRGVRRLADDPLADWLRRDHGATDADSTLSFSRLLNGPPMRQIL